MINSIKNKYYSYPLGEFLPIYSEGEMLNKKEFHIYKLKSAIIVVLSAIVALSKSRSQ